jgi:hypothetical protein
VLCRKWLQFEEEYGTLEDYDRAVLKVSTVHVCSGFLLFVFFLNGLEFIHAFFKGGDSANQLIEGGYWPLHRWGPG